MMVDYARFNLVVQDENGTVVDGASISVQNETTLAFPQLYSDRTGASALGNPFTASDGADAGFHVTGGAYKITATLGGFSRTWRYVPIGTTAESDALSLDYEFGTWTPTLTFETPGDLNVAYGVYRTGRYAKIGNLVVATFQIGTSTFTHSTASGILRITGLPYLVHATFGEGFGGLLYQGITKANYTSFHMDAPANTTYLAGVACGSGQPLDNPTAANMPSGGTVILQSTVPYFTAS